MKIFVVVLVIIQYILSFANWWDQALAISITPQNFNEIVGKEKHVIIEFFTPWCTYCQQLLPIWNQLFTDYNNNIKSRKDVIIAKFNCAQQDEFCYKQHVNQYPTIKHYSIKSIESKNQFNGHRQYDQLKNWIENVCGKEEVKQIIVQQEKQLIVEKPKRIKTVKKVEKMQISFHNNSDLNQRLEEQLNIIFEDVKEIKEQQSKVEKDLKKLHKNFTSLPIPEKIESLFDQIHDMSSVLKDYERITKNYNKVITQILIGLEDQYKIRKQNNVIQKESLQRVLEQQNKIQQYVEKELNEINKNATLIEKEQDNSNQQKQQQEEFSQQQNEGQDQNNSKHMLQWEQMLIFIIIGCFIGYLFTFCSLRLNRKVK